MQLLKRCKKQRISCAKALNNCLIIKEHVFYSRANTGQKSVCTRVGGRTFRRMYGFLVSSVSRGCISAFQEAP